MELIIVLVIVGIVVTPIANGLMQSIRINARAQAIKDATFLAQKYSEIVQNQGATEAGFIGTLPQEISETVNANQYTIKCEQYGAVDVINTGTFAQLVFSAPHWKFESDPALNNVNIAAEKINNDGTTTSSDIQAPCSVSNRDYTIVVTNGNNIDLYDNNKYPDESETKPWETVRSDFQTHLKTFSTVIADGSNVKNIYLTNKDTTDDVNVSIYNLMPTAQAVHLFYSDSDNIVPHYKSDTNIQVHDMQGVIAAAVQGTVASRTYTISVRKTGETDAIVTRKVTRVN